MKHVHLGALEFAYDPTDPEGFRAGMARFGSGAEFPKGPEGAHQVRNDADEPARVLMWSTSVVPTATAYPDSDKVGIWTGVEGEDVMARRSATLPYYDGEAPPSDVQP